MALIGTARDQARRSAANRRRAVTVADGSPSILVEAREELLREAAMMISAVLAGDVLVGDFPGMQFEMSIEPHPVGTAGGLGHAAFRSEAR